ncbi:NAD(P)/FAD-dependent oxidoreductase [Comamonas endophytica]|uniref:NAD(P)/FAD-dependent oxidoreductase n=1 Tax=Comamonas endophytica TaxID=2949090 RepID=A0ABY6GH88_9BURK|nr:MULTISPECIES: NAD(P)/FAD-dependent oxidoreductase [unclassified Acidovorax]MCD2513365.1 NAD(P)/FAD-dependent oxidoreductase [Acidovorax sp. D4N7]UYG53852.1 NAD(P)/FAD-dependent oxidoreductase [Acidovorax sp. 5MLIR]
MVYDALIIGGSYAGLAAALPLARARRKLLVVDAGQRRNRFAEHSHGFLTQDGSKAADIAALARAQLMAYETVEWLDAMVLGAQRNGQDFQVDIEGGPARMAKRLVLALGVVDTLPEVPGLAQRWGQHVFHCPYCHGYELQQGRIGVLATSELSLHQALLLPDWGATTLLLNGSFEPDAQQRAQLQSRGVTIEATAVREITGHADVILEDGRVQAFDGLFIAPRSHVASPVAAALGCEFSEGPMGAVIQTDAMKATTVPGVFACGDAARFGGSVALAVGDGTLAGVAAHRSLVFGGH